MYTPSIWAVPNHPHFVTFPSVPLKTPRPLPPSCATCRASGEDSREKPTYGSSNAQGGEEEYNPGPASVLAGTRKVVDGALVCTAGGAGAVASACHLVRDVRLCRRCVIHGCIGCKGDQQRSNLLSLQPDNSLRNKSWNMYSCQTKVRNTHHHTFTSHSLETYYAHLKGGGGEGGGGGGRGGSNQEGKTKT